MKNQILEGLAKLDTSVDSHWTKDGEVNLATLKFVGGVTATRDQIEESAPGFNRETAETYFEKSDKKEATEQKEGTASNVVTSKLEVKLNVDFDSSIKSLIESLADVNVTELSDEQLKDLVSALPERRNQLIKLRNEFANFIDSELHALTIIQTESDNRKPTESIADQMRAFSAANRDISHPIDMPTARPRSIVPLMRK